MNEQELLEQIAKRLTLDFFVRCLKLSTGNTVEQEAIKEASVILTLIKQAGWKSPDEVAGMVGISKDEAWQDKPDKSGYWWMCPYVDGNRYLPPRMKEAIDFQAMPRRGLEVYEVWPKSVPVDEYVLEYYPNSKWLYIPEPTLAKLKERMERDA